MSAALVREIALGVATAWGVITVLHALFEARKARWEPAEPEIPHEHHH